MSLIFVDCEADGPCPDLGNLIEFGAVDYKSRLTFHGVLWYSKPDINNPVHDALGNVEAFERIMKGER